MQGMLRGVLESSSSANQSMRFVVEGAQGQHEKIKSALRETEQLGVTVLHMSNKTKEAVTHAEDAREEAHGGTRTMDLVINSINEVEQYALKMRDSLQALGKQADNIGSVITVINDIADQTNLLALNAAIEAARAGEAGRGFAVVADEVRKLAEKTMSATKEVEEVVNSIQRGTDNNVATMGETAIAVENARNHAANAGEALRGIAGIVNTTTEEIQAIGASCREQLQISDAVSDITATVDELAVRMEGAIRMASEAGAHMDNLLRELEKDIHNLRG
jgi:methyl-accepting chemotaxis protein